MNILEVCTLHTTANNYLKVQWISWDRPLICDNSSTVQSVFLRDRIFKLSWGISTYSWLKHCFTTRKVAVSIPAEVIGIFRW